jgi:hypothetical protein
MSMSAARINCTQCDYETREFHRPILLSYRLADGTEVECGRAKGWCFDCDAYRDIESADHTRLARERDERDRRIAALRAGIRNLSRGFLGWFRNRAARSALRDQIKWAEHDHRDLTGLLRVAQLRKSRPRCLECWSERTAPVSFDDSGRSDFVHACGGRLLLVEDESERFAFATTRFVLDPEGRLLEEREQD